jgi:hypothetical protein
VALPSERGDSYTQRLELTRVVRIAVKLERKLVPISTISNLDEYFYSPEMILHEDTR